MASSSTPEDWIERARRGEQVDAVPAATVVLLRDGPTGLETLMVRRNSKLDFAGGAWVFPGGRVDPGDIPESGDELEAARAAAVREAGEEAGLAVDAEAMVPFAHWVPPPVAPKRFATWFFMGPAPEGAVTIDGGEIHDHRWLDPDSVLASREAGEIELLPPTWVTLHRLARFDGVDAALDHARATPLEYFETHIARVDGGVAALWQGDAGYDTSDPDVPGTRHRLYMVESGWRYDRAGLD
jgi:8-oxo-dGTP pyrophosphatase MutT (NUDIX family)